LGGTVPAELQGVSLVPYLHHQGEEMLAYSETLFPKIHMGWSELRSLRSSKWKYIRAPRPELYDLTSDPTEIHNVAPERPDQVKLFEARLAALASDRTIHTNTINEQTLRELQSLGYLAGGGGRDFELNGTGIDPKDRVGVLKLLEEAVAPGARTTSEQRIILLRQAQSVDPKNPEVLDQLGEAYENAHQYTKALNTYERSIKSGVENARIYSRLGNIQTRFGKRQNAILAYERALQFNPSDIDTQSNLATAYVESGRLADAEQVCKRILVLNPRYAPAHNGLGIIAIRRGDASSARTHFERAVEINPDLAEAWLNLGLLYKQAGEPIRARTAFSRFISLARGSAYAKLIPKVQDEIASLQ
jgi:choline-sulfatase